MSNNNTNQRPTSSASTAWLYKNVDKSEKKAIINNEELTDIYSGPNLMSLVNLKPIGSYNWSTSESSRSRPVVIIPGAAAILKHNLSPRKLEMKGNMKQIVEENKFRQPEYPLEALFRAVQMCSPQFDFSAVHFVTDRNNLRKLLGFVENKREKFRIDFQLVGNMVIFVRNEKRNVVWCDNYGKDFERKYTTSSLRQGSHRRIVSYKFGDFNMLVRFEVDCVIKEQQTQQPASSSSYLNSPVDDLARGMNRDLRLSLGIVKKFGGENSSLHYIEHGEFDQTEPQRLVELTSRDKKKRIPDKKWEQLFFSGTDALIIGWHSEGQLEKIEKLSFDQFTERSNRSMTDTEKSLAKLHNLFERIRKFALEHRQNRIESQVYSMISDYNGSSQEITIYKCVNQNGVLPADCRQSILNSTQN